ncbi:hypothetical protein FA95DRAFT_1612930 [Auriscalpium vulgare]|uniref:Uncharacterized protein n=1 Tax=Auriscalpium vulgare TaxID=40419 RepID=A0ACB8R4F8_9AGAM|nr:hypothetical protein FA95DRAFT_1612930 [Auriscalpium vulgare]
MQFNISTIVGFFAIVGLASALPGPETSLTKRTCTDIFCTIGLPGGDITCCSGTCTPTGGIVVDGVEVEVGTCFTL